MVKKILIWASSIVAAVLLVASGTLLLVLFFLSEPLGPLPGNRLAGEEVVLPDGDWTFADEFMSLQIETRPSDPYSVTTTFFVHNGNLYIPSVFTEWSRWTHFIQEDAQVRIRVDGKVYRGRASKLEDPAVIEELAEDYGAKYPQIWETRTREEVLQFWYFRVD
jgi:hypothetical protein